MIDLSIFERERMQGVPMTAPLHILKNIEEFSDGKETAIVYIADCNGFFAFGYHVIYTNGIDYDVLPNSEFGLFKSANFAEGYALSLIYQRSKLSELAKKAILEKIMPLSQYELF